ncbi:heptosyltransferase-2 [Methanococcus maripaludis]|uniref:Heptosyltransferase-2 n=1 Tax=Methanococcus maripaludis TaxID=39152 RepID=A0A7J9NH07_METMI|nr:glycosyltransferase family 9 protein [Methanococcus maripaludis]MBA2840135.1 heptosyltransferase-2 [Methanococcus maripaludis]
MGEVIRCTPIITKIKETFENPEIWWVTDYPELIPDMVDHVLKFDLENYTILKNIDFDIVYSLDKELICCSLANEINAETKKGFKIESGKISTYDKDAEYLWIRGIDDKLMKKDTRNYIDLIFETSGFNFNDEKYLLPNKLEKSFELDGKKKIGLNTGTSKTWITRIWKKENWEKLIELLLKENYEIILLGGPEEKEINEELTKKYSEIKYFGVMPICEYISLLDSLDVIVTQVTFAQHLAIGLNKKIVLLNNIFNKNEYYFYNTEHIILEPDLSCKMCYKSKFDNKCLVSNCMDLIKPEQVYNSVQKLVK